MIKFKGIFKREKQLDTDMLCGQNTRILKGVWNQIRLERKNKDRPEQLWLEEHQEVITARNLRQEDYDNDGT